MKVTFKYGIGSFSGTTDMATFYATKRGTGSIMRKWVLPKTTDQNVEIKSVSQNLNIIWGLCSEDYKSDLKIYADRDYQQNTNPEDPFTPMLSNYAVFTKLMWAFQAANSASVDLKTLTYNDINTLYSNQLGTVLASIEEGLLRSVTPRDDLIHIL